MNISISPILTIGTRRDLIVCYTDMWKKYALIHLNGRVSTKRLICQGANQLCK